jgi:tetratricopeptide (TPR) repeat protein
VFVGRDREVARLKDGLSRISAGLVYGVAGVGKSALVHVVASEWGDRAVYSRVTSESAGVLVDDARRQLARGAVPELMTDEERIADLVERLESEPAMWVVDDLHALDPKEASVLVCALSRSLREGRFIATSRHKLARRPGDPDRLELTLEGLDEGASRALWGALDELYGTSSGFDAARGQAAGNPFRLRHAHAGALDDDDPIAATLDTLSEDETEIAGALALSGRSLPTAVFDRLVGADKAKAALRRLVTRLVVEVDGSGAAWLHALFAESLAPRLASEERIALHTKLAELVPSFGLADPIAEVRERARHLRGAGRYADAAQVFVDRVAALVRDGAAGEIVRGIEAIPAEHRSPAAELALARGYSRLLNLEQAYAILSSLEGRAPDPTGEIRLALATTALSAGRIEAGAQVIARALAEPALTETIRTELVMQRAWARYHAGACDDARREVMAWATDATRPIAAFFCVVTLMQQHHFGPDLAEAIDTARGLLPDKAPPYTAKVTVPMALAAALARLGRLEEAGELAEPAEAEAKGHEDVQTQVYVRRMRADLILARGGRLEALELFRATADAYRRAGSRLGHLLGLVSTARLLMELGRRREATRLVDEAEAGARKLGLGAVLLCAAGARAADPLVRLEEARGSVDDAQSSALHGLAGDHRSDAARIAGVAALAAAAEGKRAAAERGLEALARVIGGSGYGVERVFAAVTKATLARLDGRLAEGDKLAQDARSAAQNDGVDDDFVDLVAARVGEGRAVTASTRRALGSETAPSGYEVVLDGRKHELRSGKKVVSLAKRPTLRKLLYAMAGRPNEALSKGELAAAIWPGRYDPLRHDGALWVNLRRLRQLLAPTRLVVELWGDGYRLVVPESFVYLDPGAAEKR